MKPSTSGKWCAPAEDSPDEVSIRACGLSLAPATADPSLHLQPAEEYQLWDNFIDQVAPDSGIVKSDFRSP